MVTQVEAKGFGVALPSWGDMSFPLAGDLLSFLNRGGISSADYMIQGFTQIKDNENMAASYAKIAIYGGVALAIIGLVRS